MLLLWKRFAESAWGSAAVRSGPTALAARREGDAQGLRPFRCGEEGERLGERRAGSRPSAFRYAAVAAYSSRKVPAGESASGFPAGIVREDCAACRKNKKSVDKGWEK